MITNPDDIMPYLHPLFSRGEGQVRDQYVRGGEVSQTENDVAIMFSHAKQGKYTVHLQGFRLTDSTLDDATDLSIFGNGTWFVTQIDDGWKLNVRRRNIFGPHYAIAMVDAISIERHEPADLAPGACKVCGSTKAQLRMPLHFEVDIIGENEFKWDGENGEFVNVLTQAACANCKTPLASQSMGSLKGSLNGHDLDKKTRFIGTLNDLQGNAASD